MILPTLTAAHPTKTKRKKQKKKKKKKRNNLVSSSSGGLIRSKAVLKHLVGLSLFEKRLT